MTGYARFATTTLLLLAGLIAQPAKSQQPGAVFEPYATLLQRHVVEHDLGAGGLVSSFDYRAAMQETASRTLITEQRRRLAKLEEARFERREAALAFWLNAYNFFMIAHIVEHPADGKPVDSVKDFGSLFNPYRVFGRRIFDVAGRRHSLDEIEKEILLGERFASRGWKDARVHFAVNCASVGCPALRAQPYSEANIDRLLEDNTRRALLTPLNLRIDSDTAFLTRLFDWYEHDFEQAAGSIDAFIETRLEPSRRAAFRSTDGRRFIDYDWSLNSPDNIRQWLESQEASE